MTTPETFTINEGTEKAPFLWSARMSYAVCAFLSMVLHHCMRSSVNYSILCMVASRNNTSLELTDVEYKEIEDCKSMNDNETDTQLRSGDVLWSRNEEVMFQGIFFYGYIITLPIGGLLADRFGGKFMFVYSILMEAILFMLIPICSRTSFTLASVARFFQGFVAGFGNPALYQLFTVWAHPTERTAALTFGYSGFNVGNLIVFPISSWLCKFGWDYVFYAIGGFSFFVGFFFQFFVFSTIDTHPRISKIEYEYLKAAQTGIATNSKSIKIPLLSILKSAPVYVFILTHFCHTFGVSMEALMLSRYLKEAMYFPLKDIGLISALIFSGAIISKISTVLISLKYEAKINDRNKFRKMVHLICNLCAALVTLCIVFMTCRYRWIVVALWTMISLLTDTAFALAYWPSIISLAPSYSGFLIGTANCFGTTSAFLVPIVISRLVPQGTPAEWQHVIILVAVMYLIDALTFGIFGSSLLQPWGVRKPSTEIASNEANNNKNSQSNAT